jgi:hypothetical protein
MPIVDAPDWCAITTRDKGWFGGVVGLVRAYLSTGLSDLRAVQAQLA